MTFSTSSDRPVGRAGPPPSGEGRRRPAARALRDFFHALGAPETYDLKTNPPLWVGFVMALPIPFITFAAHPPLWLAMLSLLAPFFWAAVVGATGRVGVRQFERSERLEREVARTLDLASLAHRTYEEALSEEVEKRRTLERREKAVISDLHLAEAVHRTMEPPSISRPDVQVTVTHIPAEIVGGDYLMAAVVDKRWLYLCVGDVSGHGVAAAMVVARMHGIIRRLTLENRARPVTILERVNRAALQLFRHTYFFMTLGVFRLDLQTGRLRYATAGHPAQCLLRADGTFKLLRTPNRLLGIDGDIFDPHRPSDAVVLEPGDSLVLFTDGLFEILSDKDGEVLGEEGLHNRIATLNGLEPTLLAGEILQELATFQGRSTFGDDVSLMVATYRGAAGEDLSDAADNQAESGP